MSSQGSRAPGRPRAGPCHCPGPLVPPLLGHQCQAERSHSGIEVGAGGLRTEHAAPLLHSQAAQSRCWGSGARPPAQPLTCSRARRAPPSCPSRTPFRHRRVGFLSSAGPAHSRPDSWASPTQSADALGLQDPVPQEVCRKSKHTRFGCSAAKEPSTYNIHGRSKGSSAQISLTSVPAPKPIHSLCDYLSLCRRWFTVQSIEFRSMRSLAGSSASHLPK